MMRLLLCVLAVFALSACAETDPYKRADPAPTGELSPAVAGDVFVRRWPQRFKCVQTVTIDFGPVSRTLVGYLIVQKPDSFRLQGMSEQGLKLFEIAHDGTRDQIIFAAQDYEFELLENVSRDIRRVFLAGYDLTGGMKTFDAFVTPPKAELRPGPLGTRVDFSARYHTLLANFVGDPARVDWYDFQQSDRSLYRVDHYDWADFDGLWLPSTIVLRESGVQSGGARYKLTIKITELATRDTPWPERVFRPEAG